MHMSAHHARRGVLAAVAALSTMLTAAPARAADTVTEWNEIATSALVAEGQGGIAIPHLALVHGAVFDAVNAIDRRYEPYLEPIRASRWYSKDAAAATAAYRVLVDSRPPLVAPDRLAAFAAALKLRYDATLAAIPPGTAKDGGIATGNAAADALIAVRTNDGRYGPFRFSAGTRAGQWRPELPLFVNDPGAWLKDVKPFLIKNGSQFGGPGPDKLSSRRYAKEFDEVKAVGAIGSTTRTADQTLAARFWGAANPIATWSSLYRDIAAKRGNSLADNARMFAMLYFAGADTGITVWNDKAKYSFWRPITAIREAARDGNRRTKADREWLPLINTPPYPDQPSGLSSLAGASARVLQGFFGTDDVKFGTTNAQGTRSYTSFSQVVDEIVGARVWSGIHFRKADVDGAEIGRRVAGWQQHRFPRPAHPDHDDDATGAVSAWNASAGKAALAACISPEGPGPAEARLYAMAHVAIHDALNAIDRRSRPYAYDVRAQRGTSAEAAIAAAARAVLVPGLRELSAYAVPACIDAGVASVEADYRAALAAVPDGPAKLRGIELGQAAATEIRDLRAKDRVTTLLVPDPTYPQGTAPGEYRFTPGTPFAFGPRFGEAVPFVLHAGSQFRPGPPHAVTDRRYTADFNEIKRLGGNGVTTPSARTPDQTQIALFWVESSPLQWNRIARTASLRVGLDAWEEARLFALLNLALTDGYIGTFETKYHYSYWRPVTAIRLAATDGNRDTMADPAWTPLRQTPPIPDYDSGHAVQGGTAAAVLQRFFGTDHVRFSTCSTTLPEGSRCNDAAPAIRSYASFSQASEENGISRILVGYHFREAVEVGIDHGAKIGRLTVDRVLQPVRHDHGRAAAR
jgi:hypothetical protein